MLQRAGTKAELMSVTDGVGTQNAFAAPLGKEPTDLLFTNAQFIFCCWSSFVCSRTNWARSMPLRARMLLFCDWFPREWLGKPERRIFSEIAF